MSFANTNKALGAGALLLAGAIVPCIAHAGLGDFFGVAGAVTAITDVTWKIYLVKTVAAMGPLILLITAMIATIAASWAAVHIGNSFADTLRTALRDGVITKTEWGVIALQAAYTIPLVILLSSLAMSLSGMVSQSWQTMKNFTPPPPVEEPPIVTKLKRT